LIAWFNLACVAPHPSLGIEGNPAAQFSRALRRALPIVIGLPVVAERRAWLRTLG
jgi:hypothetical protein